MLSLKKEVEKQSQIHYNKCMDEEMLPDELALAQVITLYKRGMLRTWEINTVYPYYNHFIRFAPLLFKSAWLDNQR